MKTYKCKNWIWYSETKNWNWKETKLSPMDAYYLEKSLEPQTVEEAEDYARQKAEQLAYECQKEAMLEETF